MALFTFLLSKKFYQIPIRWMGIIIPMLGIMGTMYFSMDIMGRAFYLGIYIFLWILFVSDSEERKWIFRI